MLKPVLTDFLHLPCFPQEKIEEEQTQQSQLFRFPSFLSCSCLGSSWGQRSLGQNSWLRCTRWRQGSPKRHGQQRIARSVWMLEAWNGPLQRLASLKTTHKMKQPQNPEPARSLALLRISSLYLQSYKLSLPVFQHNQYRAM